MKSYPIWTDVEACIYKSSKSFGAKDTSTQTINVGTSAKNSHEIATICTTRREVDDEIIFKFSVDGEVLKTLKFDNEMTMVQSAEWRAGRERQSSQERCLVEGFAPKRSNSVEKYR